MKLKMIDEGIFRLIESSSRLRIVDTAPEEAYAYAKGKAEENGVDMDAEYPDFIKSYKTIQKKLKKGWTKRKDMPVINPEDIARFKTLLEKGLLDVKPPWTDKNSFPQFLNGSEAVAFTKKGLMDGDLKDDKIKVKACKVKVSDLKPIQQEVYMDKSWDNLVKFGKDATKSFLQKGTTIISNDNYIIDGHHRLTQAMFIDTNMSYGAIMIDLPIDTLLKISLSYGDAIGNKRNV